MVAISLESIAQDARLVTALRDHLVATIMAPAVEALSRISVNRIRPVVERHVIAGRLDVARNLVAAEIEVASVAAEASRHMHDSDCRLCPDLWQHCETLEALEAREDCLHQQIARWGGF
jgi:hypothetical protein